MKDKVAYKQTSRAENQKQTIKAVWDTEITQTYCESLVSSMPRRIQAVIDCILGGHIKYRNVMTLILLDIKFQIVLYYAFGEINLYNLV